MKRIVFIILIGFWSSLLFCQDIIVKRNGVEINSKIIEITSETVKYKEFDFQNGPIRNISISEVFMIIYENGQRETFKKTEPQQPVKEPQQPEKVTNDNTYVTPVPVTPYNQNGLYKGHNYQYYRIKTTSAGLWAGFGCLCTLTGVFFLACISSETPSSNESNLIIGSILFNLGLLLWISHGIKHGNNKRAMEQTKYNRNLSFGVTENGVGITLHL